MTHRISLYVAGVTLALCAFTVAAAGPVEDARAAIERGDYAAARQLVTPLALAGDAVAQYQLGVISDAAHDFQGAADWYRKSATWGYARAQYNLGWDYDQGQGVGQDYVQALAWYRKAAEQGYAAAEYSLGRMYSLGLGAPGDDIEASVWYRRAAEQGFVLAQFNLGLMYAQGQGVDQDYAQALSWYGKAANKGNAAAQYSMGEMYRLGLGVPRSSDEAQGWYVMAAAQGYAPAQARLDAMVVGRKGHAHRKAAAVSARTDQAEGSGDSGTLGGPSQ